MGLRFDMEEGTFFVTRHEWDRAEELGLFKTYKIEACVDFDRAITFENFVDKFYGLRLEAEERHDEISKLFYKLVLNSCYGKFAQSSENYCEQRITDASEDLHLQGWEFAEGYDQPEDDNPRNSWIVWKRPSLDETMYNVATGCSITGAARAMLMQAIANSKRPIYCDTDSLICEDLPLAKVSKRLGDWKLECEADRLAIAGKKLYALFNGGECVKQANKGVKISAEDIVKVCEGKEILCERDAPSFKLDGSLDFISRRVKMTGRK
jgi:hypothetical protein